MISKKLLGLTALAAAASLAPSALAATPGSLASLTITLYHNTGDAYTEGLPATTTVNLAGDTVTTVATCSGQVRKTIVGTGGTAIVSTQTFDAAGNLLSRRDATWAGTDYTYDPLGRKLTETDAAIAGKVRSYAYDLANRLITATDPLGVVTTYAYDLRDRKISESTPMNGTETRLIQYGYNGRGHMTTLTDANGAVTTWGFDSAGRQITKLYANGDHRSMAYDGNGNVRALVKADAVNQAASGIAERYAYDGFGREISAPHLASRISFLGFSTKSLDAETGMNYYGYRCYLADAGRWINRDPIMEKGGMNVYAMAGNDVINKWDVLSNACCMNPCKEAADKGLMKDGAVGAVICCNGVKTVCNFAKNGLPWTGNPPPNDTAATILSGCILEHEKTHLNDITCSGSGLSRPPFNDGVNQDQAELNAYDAEIRCIESKKEQCGDDALCRQLLQRRIDDINNNYKPQYK